MIVDRCTGIGEGFKHMRGRLAEVLMGLTPINLDSWQGKVVTETPQGSFLELQSVSLEMGVPFSVTRMNSEISPNQPWADQHFRERVGGLPLNPPPSHTIWPHAGAENAEFMSSGKFSHTYPERMWPRHAGPLVSEGFGHMGIRYRYGDLKDLLDMLIGDRFTRQAYLPIWFPEDTGANAGQRVPCTLGYHFMIRKGLVFDELTCTYYIRSCDLIRHFSDDVYLAMRLADYVAERLNHQRKTEVVAKTLLMHVASLHCFAGDSYALQQLIDQAN